MSQTYQARRRTGTAPQAQTVEAGANGPSMQELAAGAQPTQEQMGHRVDLPDAIREKMESSFGADFSNVKLYESETVAQAGAEAMTQGANIAFAPGQLDLASTAGQAVLGHELSHVVSQARGESAGQGFLNDAHLEAQADMQGEMAARGESVYSGPVTPVGASSAVSAAGPMQAKKKEKKGSKTERENPELYKAVSEATERRGDAQFGEINHTDSIRREFRQNRQMQIPGRVAAGLGVQGMQELGKAAMNWDIRDAQGNKKRNPLDAYDEAMGQGVSSLQNLYQGRLARGLAEEPEFIELPEDNIIELDDLDDLDPDMFEFAEEY